MASEYLRWKYRDVKPDAPLILTPKERRANWWHYHKWHVLLGLLLALAALDLGYQVAGFGQVKPDYQIAYVGGRLLPEEAAAALETALAALGEDGNGDGRVVVELHQYLESPQTVDGDAALYAAASAARLMGDLQHGDSALFLLENPEKFQRDYEILTGEAPLLWAECPVLAALPLGTYADPVTGGTGENQSLFSGVYLARRQVPEGRGPLLAEGYAALWARLTEGAASTEGLMATEEAVS